MRELRAGQVTRQPLTSVSSRRMLTFLPQAALLLDTGVLVLLAVAAATARAWLDWFSGPLDVRATFWSAGPVILAGWIALIALLGGYRERWFGDGVEEYKIILYASLWTAGLTGVVAYLTQFQLSRSFYLLVFSFGGFFLMLERFLLRRALHQARRGGALRHDVLIAGTPPHIDTVAGVLRRESWLGLHVLGAVVPADCDIEETSRGVPILGTTDNIVEVLDSSNADVLFVAGGALEGAQRMRELVWELENHRARVVVAPSLTDVSRERVRIRPVAGLPLVHVDPPTALKSRGAKRIFDVLAATFLLIWVIPVLVFVGLWIKFHDRGSVFFRQTRIGKDGVAFNCLKLRTMVTDAEAKLAKLHAEQGFNGTGLFKMKDDPRITRPGRFLRRYSLDELPQLVNVLRGHMSLVGPRPPLPSEVETYDRFTRRRLRVRPGMTGLWQVSGRSELTWAEAVRLDLYYVDNWSMLQDVSILVKTFGAVVGSRGAY
jgi:exopolysaccharide biosynthesis polyprenyl glycosylphosphotransferase